jgi:hypothetical protein
VIAHGFNSEFGEAEARCQLQANLSCDALAKAKR